MSQNDTIIEPVVNAGTLNGFSSSYFLDTTDFAVTKVWIVDVGYVGDQLSNGTIFAPFTAIQQAFDSCSVSDIVLVYPGTYPAEHLHPIIDSIDLLSLSGASQTFVALTASGGTGFDMDSEGMTIDGFTFTGDNGFLVQLEGGEDAFTLRNCIIDTEGSPSIGLNIGAAGCSNMIVENNKFVSETGDGAIWMEKNVTNVLIRNNWFVGVDSTSSYAIQTAGSTGGRYIGNLIEGYASGIFLHTVTATSGGTANELIASNTIRNCSKGIRLGHSSMTVVMDSINVWNNLVYNCSFGIDVTDDAQVETETFNITGNNLQQNTVNKNIPGAAKPFNDANNIEGGITMSGDLDITPISTSQLKLPMSNDAVTPTIVFGDGNTGFYESSDNTIEVSLSAASRWQFVTTHFGTPTAVRCRLLNEDPSDTNPNIVPTGSDSGTGIGRFGVGALSLIADNVEMIRLTEAATDLIALNGNVTITPDGANIALTVDGQIQINGLSIKSTTAGITATNPGIQGDSPLTTDINEVSIVGAGSDAVTLPTAQAGLEIFIINNGANVLEIWPASGDDLGAGVDTATTLAAGSNVTFVSYNDTNWETK